MFWYVSLIITRSTLRNVLTVIGVAYFIPGKSNVKLVKVLQTWPGKEDKTENKVPTRLIYHDDEVADWGFLCDRLNREDHPDPKDQQYFKLWLDGQHLREVFPEDERSFSHDDVKKWFTDYLRKIYEHIRHTFTEGTLAIHAEQWRGNVEFVFSVPTTWKSHEVANTYLRCIRDAGFEDANSKKGKKKHTFVIGLNEAEAAAIHTFRSEALTIQEKDVILVCDAGGGTTDVAMLEAVSTSNDTGPTQSQLKQLGYDSGKNIGSVKIDQAFVSLVEGRLKKALELVPAINRMFGDDERWARNTAWEMAKGEFQYYKCAFGKLAGTFKTFKIKIPDFPWKGTEPAACIADKKMQFTQKDLQSMFDAQLIGENGESGLYSILDAQLRQLQETGPAKQVQYLVLSGGLGSSVYLKDKLIKRYVNKTAQYPNTKDLKIIAAEEPQLAVVQGLVINQVERLKVGRAVLKSRTCRASYGVLCEKEYDKSKHLGMKVATDELDGKLYAINLIHWFVRKGDSVSEEDRIEYDFGRKVKANDKSKGGELKSVVVISHEDRNNLPKTLGDGI